LKSAPSHNGGKSVENNSTAAIPVRNKAGCIEGRAKFSNDNERKN